MKSDKPFIKHIAASIVAIESYVAGGRNVFMREQMIRDALIASRQRRVGAMRCGGEDCSDREVFGRAQRPFL